MKKQPLNPRFAKQGECIFPFKFKRTRHYDCTDSSDKPPLKICATAVKKTGTLEKFGVCLPEGVTPEQVQQKIDKEQKELDANKPTYKFTFKRKKNKNNEPKFNTTTTNTNTIQSKKNDSKKISKIWLNTMYNDNRFNIIEVTRNGSCFFHSIEQAFNNKPIININSLRQYVSDTLTQKHFNVYKTIIDDAIKNNDRELIRETRFILELDTLEDLRDYVKKGKYWGDMLSINMIERYLKIKVFNLSETRFRLQEYNRIINSGNNLDAETETRCEICDVSIEEHTNIINDSDNFNINKLEIENYLDKHNIEYKPQSNILKLYKETTHHFSDIKISDSVKPTHFVLFNYEDGSHYKLIEFNKKRMFKKLSELPESLQQALKENGGKMINHFV